MPVPTLSLKSPFIKCGMPQLNSTTSMPRVTSPRASEIVLPCSREIALAKSLACKSKSALNLNIMRARLRAGVALQAGKAVWAASIALSVSSTVALLKYALTLPVAGLKTSLSRALVPATCLPLM